MTVTTRDAQALTYLATRIREETYSAGTWDQTGTYAVIAELVGQNLSETIRRVVGHASDPEARTPGAIKRPFVPKSPPNAGARYPAGATEECRLHRGEWASSCRACAADQLAADPEAVTPERPADHAPPTCAYLAAKRALNTQGADDE